AHGQRHSRMPASGGVAWFSAHRFSGVDDLFGHGPIYIHAISKRDRTDRGPRDGNFGGLGSHHLVSRHDRADVDPDRCSADDILLLVLRWTARLHVPSGRTIFGSHV